MKQLIAALVGETGSGKSTFAAMCTDENIHNIVAGEWGKKGTTKEIKKMLYAPSVEFDLEKFNKAYLGTQEEFLCVPLSSKIDLGKFDALLLLDTQGINDWKTEEEKEKVYNEILVTCDEADIIFAMIPEGGSTVSTQCILDVLFEKYCHKPIILVNKTVEAEVSDLKYVKCDEIKELAEKNLEMYSKVYNNLAVAIKSVGLPNDISIGVPLLCLLPNSEEITSNKPVERLKSTNNDLRECINLILNYAITLQTKLIDVMSKDYVSGNSIDIQTAHTQLVDVTYAVGRLKAFKGIPLVRPYIKHSDFKNREVEYSWQGGTPAYYDVCGGDYTYTARDIYNLIKQMIYGLNINVGIKSCLLAILEKDSYDRDTPGTLNLDFGCYSRGVNVERIIDARTKLYNKHPNLFRDIHEKDFDNKKQWEHLNVTAQGFKVAHPDWNKILEKFYFYKAPMQQHIQKKFNDNEWRVTVFIWLVIEYIKGINFAKATEKEMIEQFWENAFDENGECILWQ